MKFYLFMASTHLRFRTRKYSCSVIEVNADKLLQTENNT
jgi:hypothetical protein